ncbi:hypothetical protein ACFSJW_24720 [Flavobacterium artemisiae]|uniref:Uncharacterized protein n=1 Tax=Flavobacterium artemisiae TaxID=2126556 RepID=A0ABW4HC05_9FLAO
MSNHKQVKGVYSLGVLSKKLDFEEMLYLLKEEILFSTLESENFTEDVFEDIFSILEILLRLFKFNKSSYINDRLKNFCYVNILLNNLNNDSSEKNALSFKNILFFNPSPEEFINNNQLRNGKYLNAKKQIDFSEFFDDIFENILKLKKEKKAYSRIAKDDIELLYQFLKELINTVFESQPSKLPEDYLRLENVFTNNDNLYNTLLKSIDYFTLINNKIDNKSASLYYQSDDEFTVINSAKRNSKTKFRSEYIIDSYIYKFSNHPKELVDFMIFLKNRDTQKFIKFSIILLSHPFIVYNLEAKRNIIKSNIDEILPNKGYAYQKLTKYKEIFK